MNEAGLIDLCREAAGRDETLAVYLVPYVSFRAAKQHLPMLTLFTPAWVPLGDRDLTMNLGAALDQWAAARERRESAVAP